MKKFVIPATRRGVVIPGLSAEQVDHGPSQSEAMEASASTKLAELSAVLQGSHLDEPDLESLYFQVAAEGPGDSEQDDDVAKQSTAAASDADRNNEENIFDSA
jgi:hypothetical protein